MMLGRFATTIVLIGALAAAGCGNTIRGIGKDTANAVGATKQAGRTVAKAVK
jgi:predicted small secreted protein